MSLIIPPRLPDGLIEIVDAYGDPRPHIIDGRWTVDPEWESTHLVTIHHRLLPLGRLFVHKRIAEPLGLLLHDWEHIGGYAIHSFGCFAPRAQRGATGFLSSTHTWAIAFDLNPDTNPLITPCYEGDPRRGAAASTDIPLEWVLAAKRRGFFHGADFKRRYDPQHFQAATGY